MSSELSKYVSDCYEHEEMTKLDDVFVTDHKRVEEKMLTSSEAEDQEFFDY